jgi:hypothetical protein
MRHNRKVDGFTRKDLFVLIAACCALPMLVLIPAYQRARAKSQRIDCINNLVQIGTAYRVWENDNGGVYPSNGSVTNGGWKDLLGRANCGNYCWTNYALMSNELGPSPFILACPSDERKPANSWSNAVANTVISYFVGIEASEASPQTILGGDRNLAPGTVPKDDYGYSPVDGRGNDVTITGPVCWSLKMHSRGNASECGNILLGDGSAQQAMSSGLRTAWITNSTPLHLIFP